MEPIIIAVDLDEVLVTFVPTLHEWYNTCFGTNYDVKMYYEYNYEEIWNVSKSEVEIILDNVIQTDLFCNLPPIVDAVSVINRLFNTGYFEFHIVTARPEYMRAITELWVDKHFNSLFKKIHFCSLHSTKESKIENMKYVRI